MITKKEKRKLKILLPKDVKRQELNNEGKEEPEEDIQETSHLGKVVVVTL